MSHDREDWAIGLHPGEGNPLMVISTSPWAEPGTFLLTSRHHAEHMHEPPYFFEWEPVPATVKGEAIKIVQDGMADTVAWLRASGHDIPTWQDVERREERTFTFDMSEKIALTVRNPRRYAKVSAGLI